MINEKFIYLWLVISAFLGWNNIIVSQPKNLKYAK